MHKKMEIVILILALLLVFALTACGGNTPAEEACTHSDGNTDGRCDKCGEIVGECVHEDTDSDEKCDKCGVALEKNEEGLKLVDGGNPTFQFVFSADASDAVKSFANNTLKSINKVLNKDAKIVTENAANAVEFEIIFGTPAHRADEYKIDYHYLGPQGYAVKVVGTKVLVLYGSDDAISSALSHVKETLFGITSKTKKLDEVIATEDRLVENKQKFTLEGATVAGYDLNTYMLDYPATLRAEAQNIQNKLYTGVGIWLPKGKASATQKAVIIREISHDSELVTPNGYRVYVDGDSNLIIETEFANKLDEANTKFLAETILAAGKVQMSFDGDYVYDGFDARNIYYSEFGAKGNGKTDDFAAIKACHEYANIYGHTVNADANATYYIGKNKGAETIEVKTSTNWHGCKIIFDDSQLMTGDAAWWAYTFKIASDYSIIEYTGDELPVETIAKGATNIGWAPGYRAMVVFKDNTRKVYIRYDALLADNGQDLREFVIVDKDGNIDPSTPMNWDFTNITSIEVLQLNSDSIVINGGEYDKSTGVDNRAILETRVFQNLTYTPEGYRRGTIDITRANVTFKNVVHQIVGEYDVEYGCSYDGFTHTSYADNVRFENITFQRYRVFDTRYRSYEVRAEMSNNISWYNCNMSNFFGDNGQVYTYGMMGTNFCKNMEFDRVDFNTFDAHCGSYNVTIKNSTLVYLSIIGCGKLTVENTTFYTTREAPQTHAIWLRTDYGSHYDGDIEIDGVTIKYADYREAEPEVALISAVWNNHNFGYETVLGRSIKINNVKMEKIEYGLNPDGERWEKTVKGSNKLYLFTSNMYVYTSVDITSSVVAGGAVNRNPYKGPESITITNCDGVDWALPTANMPQFKNTVVTVDGIKQY